jgi:hypothetical protein
VGGSVDAGARFLSAEAFTSDGVRGSATRTVPTTAIAGDGRWRVRDRLELRASLGVELSWVREQFEVRGEEIGDAGRARARLVIGIVF